MATRIGSGEAAKVRATSSMASSGTQTKMRAACAAAQNTRPVARFYPMKAAACEVRERSPAGDGRDGLSPIGEEPSESLGKTARAGNSYAIPSSI